MSARISPDIKNVSVTVPFYIFVTKYRKSKLTSFRNVLNHGVKSWCYSYKHTHGNL